jgi:hypothetical protein
VVSDENDLLPLGHGDHQVAWRNTRRLVDYDVLVLQAARLSLAVDEALPPLHLLVHALLRGCRKRVAEFGDRIDHAARVALQLSQELEQGGSLLVL